MSRPQYFYAMGPHFHEYMAEMNCEALSKYDIMTVGEAFGVTLEQTPSLVDERRNELNMIFNFDAVRLNRDGDRWRDWTLPELKAVYTRQNQALDVHSWNTIFLSNHDNPLSSPPSATIPPPIVWLQPKLWQPCFSHARERRLSIRAMSWE